ncbi:VOC family protein [Photobacterium satsumensis]|uniref:VOC family protein n=1 Tax=Photobacterium satsumensis TaxID=2910239 RepID=UPI003D10B6A0
MKTIELSTCFCTTEVDSCREYYIKYFAAKAVFDCGWYVMLKINQDGPEICFIQPQENMAVFDGKGVMLNFKVEDVDAEYSRLSKAGLQIAMPLEDHPWGDRGFSVIDPIGNSVYIYSEREPSGEFKQYFNG